MSEFRRVQAFFKLLMHHLKQVQVTDSSVIDSGPWH